MGISNDSIFCSNIDVIAILPSSCEMFVQRLVTSHVTSLLPGFTFPELSFEMALLVTSCVGLRVEEPQTWVSHIATSVLTGFKFYPINQFHNLIRELIASVISFRYDFILGNMGFINSPQIVISFFLGQP